MHVAGDHALVVVADHLRASLRAGDLLARFGGDEFVALLTDVSTQEAAEVVDRLTDVRHLQGPRLTLSVGWAVHGPALEDLLGRADAALYAAKAAGRGRAVAAPAGVAGSSQGLPAWGHLDHRQLSEAIDRDQLTLHFQPKVSASDGTVDGVEALVRWDHPQLGLRHPDSFLPQVEELGLMPALTDRVLQLALDQLLAWDAGGLPGLSIAVNLSGSSLSDSTLPGRVIDALEQRGLDGSRLVLEVTEQCLIEDRAHAGQVLDELRRHRVRISLDDFGTGYSSLAYLRDLPIDELKLDRSFVFPMTDDARAAALVVSTISLAHSLGLRMVAEGVEDASALAELARHGCDEVQGFHLSRPVPALELELWLDARQTAAAL